ncbi:Uncharacterised protein [Kingella potus]|uniref:Uncharacterized protein n=1 Tax=Kingella potus TaxID=265175 RepID=A0A377R5B7_9NEIS|nr:hypothetical protein [Kingella potus]UOP01997.1 hypothetical protein LVJ84_14585 [Kingella potus]STR03424.1 Uncharacterised protein [Kingella potus]
MKCLQCQHADLRTAAERGLTGLLVCAVSREKGWRCLNPATECENGRFQAAGAEAVRKRAEWLQRRRTARIEAV